MMCWLLAAQVAQLIAYTKSDFKKRFEMTDSDKWCAFVLGIELVDNDDGSQRNSVPATRCG